MRKWRVRRSRPHLILYWEPSPTPGEPAPAAGEPQPGERIGPHLLEGFTQALKPRSRGDLATALIEGFLGDHGQGFRLRAGWMLRPQISAIAIRLGAGHRQPLTELAGWQTLSELADEIRQMMRTIAARHDPGFWYALLVRAQPLMIAWLGNVATLALPAIGSAVFSSPRKSTLAGFLTAPWRVPPSVMTELDQLIYLGLVLSNIEIAKRRVGKGQEVALVHEGLFHALFHPGTEVAAAIDLLDERVAAAHDGPAAALGAYGTALAPLTAQWPMIVWGSLINQPALHGPLLRQALREWDPVFPILTDLKQMVPAAFLPGSFGLTGEAQAVAVLDRPDVPPAFEDPQQPIHSG
jgi:hypothetical protein